MKNSRSLLLFTLILFGCARSTATEILARAPLAAGQIAELVSPIALYPDPLVALILPATTWPADIVLAARFLDNGGSPDQAAAEPWDDSVKALTRYPEALTYLDRNLAWSRSLGDCFLERPDEVMAAIQTVRQRARAAGLLVDTSEQAVLVESGEIRIVPADPTVIYVPRYSPEILYVTSFPFYYSGPFLSFGIGYRVGVWLNYDCDWRYRTVRIAHRPDYWYRRPDWRGRHPDHPFGATAWNRWVPSPRQDRHFDRPARAAGSVRHPVRTRDFSSPVNNFAPANRLRAGARPATERNSFRPATVADAPRASQRPAYQRPPTPVASPRAPHAFAANARPGRQPSPAVRSAPVPSPAAPRANLAPARHGQTVVQARPAESHRVQHDRPAQRSRDEKPDRRDR